MSNVAVQTIERAAPAEDTHKAWEVDGKESFDLRPVVLAIMQAENWILERLRPKQKLFLIMGEFHINQMDIFLQHAVLNAHVKQAEKKKDRSFALGSELPHNFLHARTGEMRDDPDGVFGMEAFIENPQGSWASGPSSALFRQCLKDGISVGFHDVAQKHLHIDLSDPYTSDLVERHSAILHGKDKDKLHRVECPVGSAMSNLSIFERSLEHAERKKAKVYIVHTGFLHVAGSINHNWWYSHSLSKLFLDSGHAVLPVINGYENFGYNLSSEARAMMDRTGVKIRYLERALERNGIKGGFDYMDYEEARATVNRYSYYDL